MRGTCVCVCVCVCGGKAGKRSMLPECPVVLFNVNVDLNFF